MKKLLTLSVFLLVSVVNYAQYNRTYDINNNTDYLFPGFDIATYDRGTATVSWLVDAPSWPRTDYFILTKHDAVGNVVFNKRFDPATPLSDGLSEAKCIIQTSDRGILITGYWYQSPSYLA